MIEKELIDYLLNEIDSRLSRLSGDYPIKEAKSYNIINPYRVDIREQFSADETIKKIEDIKENFGALVTKLFGEEVRIEVSDGKIAARVTEEGIFVSLRGLSQILNESANCIILHEKFHKNHWDNFEYRLGLLSEGLATIYSIFFSSGDPEEGFYRLTSGKKWILRILKEAESEDAGMDELKCYICYVLSPSVIIYLKKNGYKTEEILTSILNLEKELYKSYKSFSSDEEKLKIWLKARDSLIKLSSDEKYFKEMVKMRDYNLNDQKFSLHLDEVIVEALMGSTLGIGLYSVSHVYNLWCNPNYISTVSDLFQSLILPGLVGGVVGVVFTYLKNRRKKKKEYEKKKKEYEFCKNFSFSKLGINL